MSAAKYKLNNWAIVAYGPQCIAPELRRQCLIGETQGHPEWEDGHTIVTSRIIGKRGELIATKSGSFIELGDPQPAYEAVFPNAKNRTLVALTEILPEAVSA